MTAALAPLTYALAVLFWMASAAYALLASRVFVIEQFLKPELFAPVAVFARHWAAIALAVLAAWGGVRWARVRGERRSAVIAALWAALSLASWASGIPASIAVVPLPLSLLGIAMLWAVAATECPEISVGPLPTSANTAADLAACGLAAVCVGVVDVIVGIARDGPMSAAGVSVLAALRTQLLAGMVVFLVLTIVRGLATAAARASVLEARLAVLAVGIVFGWFIDRVVLVSLSVSGATPAAYLSGCIVAYAVTARSRLQFIDGGDGVRSVVGGLAPKFSDTLGGLGIWIAAAALWAVLADRATRATDWNFVFARLAVVVTWLLILGGMLRHVRISAALHPAVGPAAALLVLAMQVSLDRVGMTVTAAAARTPAARWAADLLSPSRAGPEELYALLPAHTNITGDGNGQPIEVSWSKLDSEPRHNRPHIFFFVIDSIRRDYLSPYNPKVSFTPGIDGFARDSLVFERAFTQYGSTGLSIPSIWIGGALLHKQYVTPFAPMNALAKLLVHERYTQWLSMDNILDVIVPPTAAVDALDRGVPVKDFRFCRTADEIRSRLRAHVAGAAPVFAYSLPQDIHVSVISREGAQSIDGGSYDGFYAPVASRVRRLDACFNTFIADLKASGIYDNSVIILTADHGDSLGEDGRMGHAYTLFPEIVRVPLIVHVPAGLRDRYSWDTRRASFTTDITPTLYRLLGHDATSPGEFYGESLARLPGTGAAQSRSRMVAASYGSVYGAVLEDGTRLYVADAIERREWAFSLGEGATTGGTIEVTSGLRREAAQVIEHTVHSIARAYRLPPR